MSKALRSVASFFLLFHPPFNCHPPILWVFCQNTTPSFYIDPPILSKFEISATPTFNSTPPPPPPYNEAQQSTGKQIDTSN